LTGRFEVGQACAGGLGAVGQKHDAGLQQAAVGGFETGTLLTQFQTLHGHVAPHDGAALLCRREQRDSEYVGRRDA